MVPTKWGSGQGGRLLRQKSQVQILGNIWMYNYPSLAPPMDAPKKLVDGMRQVHSSVALIDLAV